MEGSQSIPYQSHCQRGDSWEHALGYLLYFIDFPTRVSVSSVKAALRIIEPEPRSLIRIKLNQFEQTWLAQTKVFQDKKLRTIAHDDLAHSFSLEIAHFLEAQPIYKSKAYDPEHPAWLAQDRPKLKKKKPFHVILWEEIHSEKLGMTYEEYWNPNNK